MILLIRSKLEDYLYNVNMIDAPSNGSTTSLYQNVIEASSLLNPFEMVFETILPRFKAFGYEIFDHQDFEAKVKPLYQILRHGLAFDWVLNYLLIKIYKTFPFCHFREFKGTNIFIGRNAKDQVFMEELQLLDQEFDRLLDQLFQGLDKTVFTRLTTDAQTTDFLACVSWARQHNRVDQYFVTEDLIYHMNYLVALGLMLEHSIGVVKRLAWHTAFDAITEGTLDGLLICGGKFRAFAYGRLALATTEDVSARWHRFDFGIQYYHGSCRNQKPEYLRVFPDEMTFFRFSLTTIFIDESFFPEVSFDQGKTWYTPLSFADAELEMDKPLKMRIRYRFTPKPDEVRMIKIKGKANCVIKDDLLLLENGEAETQLLFRGDNIGFKISEDSKEYPFAVFSNSKLKIKDFVWL